MEQGPYRYRHDGWTPARQGAFLRALRETGCIAAACRHVGLSRTSAARAYKRMPEFARAWDLMLSYVEPVLLKAAFDRAVTGWEEPVFYKGEVVGHRRRWSDALLKLLLQREERGRRGAGGEGPVTVDMTPSPMPARRGVSTVPIMPIAEVEAMLLKRLDAINRRQDGEADGLTASGNRRS